MKRPSDLLLLAILFSAALVATLAPGGGAAFRLSPSLTPSFSESLWLGAGGERAPSPDVFQSLGKLGRVVVATYDVRPKDTLASVSKRFGSGPDFLRSTNRLGSVALVPGKSLVVHNGLGMLYQIRERKGRTESLQDIARKYNLSAVSLARANHLPGVALLSDQWLEPGRVLLLPNVRLRFTDYLMPVAWTSGRLISSGFGYRRHPVLGVRRFHQGLDLPRPAGSPVRAASDGTVIFAGWRGSYGRLIILKHAGGLRTWYGHLSAINVEPGQKVFKGTFIGRVGSTGLATGPHLHFEVRDRYGNALNPKKFLF